MSSVLALKLLHKSYARTILGSSNLNVFYRRIPLQSLASFSAIQKFYNKSSPCTINIQKTNFSVSAVKRVPSEADKSHDHVMLWTGERVLALVMLGTIPAAFLISSPAIEYFLALAVSVHAHWGIEAIILDYVRPAIFGKVIPKLALASVYALTALSFGGLCYFIYTDVGLINAVKLLWKL